MNNGPCGESELREDLCSADEAFLQEYFVYFGKSGEGRAQIIRKTPTAHGAAFA